MGQKCCVRSQLFLGGCVACRKLNVALESATLCHPVLVQSPLRERAWHFSTFSFMLTKLPEVFGWLQLFWRANSSQVFSWLGQVNVFQVDRVEAKIARGKLWNLETKKKWFFYCMNTIFPGINRLVPCSTRFSVPLNQAFFQVIKSVYGLPDTVSGFFPWFLFRN